MSNTENGLQVLIKGEWGKRLRSDKFFIGFFSFLIAGHLFWISILPILPFVDLPFHLASSAVSRYYGQETNEFQKYFSINLSLKPNIIYFLFTSLKIFSTVEAANKIFFGIYIVLFPLSVLLIIMRFGGNYWYGTLTFLVLYNFNVNWGFTGFMFSLPFVLLAFVITIDFLEGETSWKAFFLSVLLGSLYFFHLLAAVFSLLLFVSCCYYRYRYSFTLLIKKLLPAIPLILILGWWFINAPKGNESISDQLVNYFTQYPYSVDGKLAFLVWDNYFLFEGAKGYWVAAGLGFVGLGVPLKNFLNKRNLLEKNNPNQNYLYCFLGCSIFFVIFLPNRVSDLCFELYKRFTVYVFVGIFIWGSLRLKTILKIDKIIICVSVLIHFVLWSDYFYSFKEENDIQLKNLFPQYTEGKKLAGIIYDNKFRNCPVYIHFPNYYIVWEKGIATSSMVDYKVGTVIRRKVSETILPSYLEWIDPDSKKGESYDRRYSMMDFILIRGAIPEQDREKLKDFELKKLVSKWSLYEKNSGR